MAATSPVLSATIARCAVERPATGAPSTDARAGATSGSLDGEARGS
jgi:hypothetical protein